MQLACHDLLVCKYLTLYIRVLLFITYFKFFHHAPLGNQFVLKGLACLNKVLPYLKIQGCSFTVSAYFVFNCRELFILRQEVENFIPTLKGLELKTTEVRRKIQEVSIYIVSCVLSSKF